MAVLLTVLCTLLASAGHALPFVLPSAGNSIVPHRLLLVGRDALGAPDPAGVFTVTVRSVFNNPIANSVVILDFGACGATSFASVGFEPGVSVDCGPARRTVRRLTDAQGMARFIIPGSRRAGIQPLSCIEVSADGHFLGRASAAILDLDGASGVGINDLSVWLMALGNSDASDCDYDGDDLSGINDLSVWLQFLGANGSLASAAPLCP